MFKRLGRLFHTGFFLQSGQLCQALLFSLESRLFGYLVLMVLPLSPSDDAGSDQHAKNRQLYKFWFG